MTTSSNPSNTAPAAMAETRPMYWSVRRELWENRSLYIAPLAVAAAVLLAFLISTIRMPGKMRALSSLDPAQQRHWIVMPYNAAGGLVILTAFLVGVFYCLDALNSERRDRSILFWKSLPVSDRTTVLSKAGIPLVVLPLLIFAVIVATQWIILLLSLAILLINGVSIATLWARLPLFQMQLALLYALVSIALWHAPIYAWLLLVSAWARRAAFLWAVLPFLAVGVLERIAFNTSRFGSLLKYLSIGWLERGFASGPKGDVPANPLLELTPGNLLSTPGLWIGLAFAAVLLAAAVRLRRHREPI